MAMFDAEAHRGFVRRITRYLLDSVPECVAGLNQDEVTERIETIIHCARSYSFESERNVSIFIELVFRYGDEFELSPAFAPVLFLLRHPAAPPDAKADLLWRQHLTLQKAEAAAAAAAVGSGS